MFEAAVDTEVRQRSDEASSEAFTKDKGAFGVCAAFSDEDGGGAAETDDAGDVGSASPQPMLLTSASQLGLDSHAVADVESADAFGAVDLVPGDGNEIHAQLANVEGNRADALGGIGVQQDAARG